MTLNDAIFRLVVTYSLIDLLGKEQSNTILAISAALFILPFLFFTYPAGQLADRYSKKKVIMWSLWAELVFMLMGFVAIMLKNQYCSYFALFLIALQSSIFNPAKLAILPEIEPRDRLSKANGILTLSIYLSIILGTFLATIICQFTNRNYLVVVFICIVFSVLAIFTGYGIETTPIKNPLKKVNVFFIRDLFSMLRVASKQPHLILAICASSYFLFTAAYTQLNLIPFGMQSLGITDVQTGYIYLAAAFGLGVGSLLVGILSGKTVELGLSLWGAFGTAISYIVLFSVQYNLFWSCVLFFSVGMHGGLFIVPLDAFIQFASPEKHRGSIVGAATMISFVAVLFSSGAIALMGNILEWRAASGYLTIGIMSLCVSFWVLVCLPEYITRLFAVLAVKFFFALKLGDAPTKALLVCRERSLVNRFSLVYSFQKIRFIKWFSKPPSRSRIIINFIFNTLPFYYDKKGGIAATTLHELKRAKQEGYTFCFFENDRALKKLKLTPRAALTIIKKEIPEPVVNTEFKNLNGKTHSFFHFFHLFHPTLSLSFIKRK